MDVQEKIDLAMSTLKEKANPDNLAGMARFGIAGEQRLGVSVPDIRGIAKRVGR